LVLSSGLRAIARGQASVAETTPNRRAGPGVRSVVRGAAAAAMTVRHYVLAILVLATFAPPALADSIESAACRIELATTWATFKEMAVRLKAVSRSAAGEKCAVYRTHALVVTHTRDVLSRCRSGREREGDIAQMDGALEDVNGALTRECTGQ
jgi:hypothetical protein